MTMRTTFDPGAGPRRILFVLQSTTVGGMETMASDLAAELARREIHVGVVVPNEPAFDALADGCRANGLLVARLTTDARLGNWHLVPRLVRFARLVQSWKPDVVHVHTGGATGGFGAMLMARLVGSSVVVATEHDVPSPTPARALRISAWLRDRIRHTLVAVSRRNASLRSERLPTPIDRFAAVLNGIPIVERCSAARQQARARIRAALAIEDDVTALTSVVRLAEGKGLHDLLHAFARVRAEHPSRLILVGDGPLRTELEQLADELDVRGSVHFVGFQRDPLPFLDASDAFVLAVPAGTGSIALLEAMAAGVPPIITFCGPEEAVIHEETGLCAPPNDPAGLADALARLIDDASLRSRLGTAAALHVRRHFSISRVADDYLELYRSACTGRVPARLRTDARSGAAHSCSRCRPRIVAGSTGGRVSEALDAERMAG